ncbi:hypothetical protein [Egicoccus sp. AB-alg2]|uniref:hypothetical protein n=1 Tax=Egicoccus sp. AB-alg2 TaxID=3242693 RepID=UPI00359E98B8
MAGPWSGWLPALPYGRCRALHQHQRTDMRSHLKKFAAVPAALVLGLGVAACEGEGDTVVDDAPDVVEDDATGDDATGDDMTGDDATGDDATGDDLDADADAEADADADTDLETDTDTDTDTDS